MIRELFREWPALKHAAGLDNKHPQNMGWPCSYFLCQNLDTRPVGEALLWTQGVESP